jgi:hypothetical protein
MASAAVRRRGWFLRTYLVAFGIAAGIGLCIGVLWVLSGLLHFHPLW